MSFTCMYIDTIPASNDDPLEAGSVELELDTYKIPLLPALATSGVGNASRIDSAVMHDETLLLLLLLLPLTLAGDDIGSVLDSAWTPH